MDLATDWDRPNYGGRFALESTGGRLGNGPFKSVSFISRAAFSGPANLEPPSQRIDNSDKREHCREPEGPPVSFYGVYVGIRNLLKPSTVMSGRVQLYTLKPLVRDRNSRIQPELAPRVQGCCGIFACECGC
jgi:hypothetical protein